ncbi:MAG: hypothetical protein HN351_06720 [Deltaproteobacteria bacterium]|jgi:hypothetical protein|nr:hypothetical protein [Deltaproteobacteria bacterium]
MNLPLFIRKVFLLCFSFLFFSSASWSQSNNYQGNGSNLELTQLSGFSDDERIKLLLLNLLPSGMTETAAVEIGKALQLNIYNTNHFTVVGPAEWNVEIRDQDPTLADCHDIACGAMIGKLFHADKVLVGTLHSEIMLNENAEEESSFVLSIRMVDTRTNITDFSDEVQFTDLQMHDELFRLAARVSDNTLLVANVLNTKPSGITLNLGRAQGIKTGQQLVISRRTSVKSVSADKVQQTIYQNIALAEVVQVSDLSAEAVIVQKISSVARGDQVQTYIDKEKLIRLISQTRKELDTQKRLKPKKRVIRLEPKVGKVSTDYSQWSYRYQQTKAQHDRWLFSTAGAGGATILFLSGVIQMSGVLSVLPWIAGAGTVYSGIRYFHYRDLMSELSTEGRSQGFISSSLTPQPSGWQLNPVPKGFQLNWIKRF